MGRSSFAGGIIGTGSFIQADFPDRCVVEGPGVATGGGGAFAGAGGGGISATAVDGRALYALSRAVGNDAFGNFLCALARVIGGERLVAVAAGGDSRAAGPDADDVGIEIPAAA